ncbi:hypothetical protein SAMN05192534_12379 [Alteribacillus persepolensis]|uniref:Uncharacterized protein n=1 Tax=Alteribacillus persepolensis TaxID=568899 RepID=A0A1G8IBD7_9BACI|nr:hypothetical protein [Alteribacillus persepolensis]SDI16318.1 hypothetical protein SAMN05192534_12379 [Alteribacillus persepolensis]
MSLLKRLTDAYNKNPNSNIAKTISLVTSQLDELTATFERIEAWRAIDNAEGKTLDDIGIDLNQYRGAVSDEIYRILLKSKTARDMSEGDTNTVIEVLSMAIDADPSEIGISETWMDADNPEPAGISLIEIPIDNLNRVGMTGDQFVQFVAGTVAAGVYVRSIELEGTFAYGAIDEALDANAGFADVDQTTGGYYGALYQPGEDRPLPM